MTPELPLEPQQESKWRVIPTVMATLFGNMGDDDAVNSDIALLGQLATPLLFVLGAISAFVANFFLPESYHCLLLAGALLAGAMGGLMGMGLLGSFLVGSLVAVTIYLPKDALKKPDTVTPVAISASAPTAPK